MKGWTGQGDECWGDGHRLSVGQGALLEGHSCGQKTKKKERERMGDSKFSLIMEVEAG